jgi:hypothetical protein
MCRCLAKHRRRFKNSFDFLRDRYRISTCPIKNQWNSVLPVQSKVQYLGHGTCTTNIHMPPVPPRVPDTVYSSTGLYSGVRSSSTTVLRVARQHTPELTGGYYVHVHDFGPYHSSMPHASSSFFLTTAYMHWYGLYPTGTQSTFLMYVQVPQYHYFPLKNQHHLSLLSFFMKCAKLVLLYTIGYSTSKPLVLDHSRVFSLD